MVTYFKDITYKRVDEQIHKIKQNADIDIKNYEVDKD